MRFKSILKLLPLILCVSLYLSACGGKQEVTEPAPETLPAESTEVSPDQESQKIVVTIDHAYKPAHIRARAGIPLTIEFFRNEKVSSCAKDIEFPDLNKKFSVMNNSSYNVTLPAQPAGKLPFRCTMDMMRGLIVFE